MKFKLTRISQNMVTIEVWDEFRFCRFSHLHEALGDADLICVTNNFLIFKCCQWTINLRMLYRSACIGS